MGVLKWTLIVGIIAVLGLSYMICKNQNSMLANETQHLRDDLTKIHQQNDELEVALERMKNPVELKRRLAANGSSLEPLGADPRICTIRMDHTLTQQIARYSPEQPTQPVLSVRR